MTHSLLCQRSLHLILQYAWPLCLSSSLYFRLHYTPTSSSADAVTNLPMRIANLAWKMIMIPTSLRWLDTLIHIVTEVCSWNSSPSIWQLHSRTLFDALSMRKGRYWWWGTQIWWVHQFMCFAQLWKHRPYQQHRWTSSQISSMYLAITNLEFLSFRLKMQEIRWLTVSYYVMMID